MGERSALSERSKMGNIKLYVGQFVFNGHTLVECEFKASKAIGAEWDKISHWHGFQCVKTALGVLNFKTDYVW